MRGKILTTLVILSLFHLYVANPLVAIEAAITAASTIITIVDYVQDRPDVGELLPGMASDLTALSNSLQRTGVFLHESLSGIAMGIPEDLQTAAQINDDLRDIFDKILNINFLFDNYFSDVMNGTITRHSLEIFVNKSTSADANGPEFSALQIFKIFHPEELNLLRNSFLIRIVTQLNTNVYQRCKRNESPQQRLLKIYTIAAITELKAFMMTSVGYALRSVIVHENHRRDIDRVKNDHIDKMKKYLNILYNTVSNATTEVSNCKPADKDKYQLWSHKAFSLLPSESDYRNNMVVTAIRFKVTRRILYVQVEEAKLGPNFQTVEGTERWVPLVGMDWMSMGSGGCIITNRNASERIKGPICANNEGNLHLYLSKSLELMRNFVVVGARFYKHYNQEERKVVVNLVLKLAGANLETGQVWPQTVEAPPEEQLNPDKRYFSMVNHHIDLQTVYANPRLPFRSVTLYDRGDQDPGNTVSLRVSAVDISPQIKPN